MICPYCDEEFLVVPGGASDTSEFFYILFWNER